MPHIHELIDFTVSAFIFHNDRVLLIHHKKLDSWMQIGGHVELDEDTDEALIREIKEECGLDVHVLAEVAPCQASSHVKPLLRPHFVNIHAIGQTHRHLDLSYVCLSDSDAVVLEDAHNDIGWFSEEEVRALPTGQIFDNVRELVLAAFPIARGAKVR